MKQEKLIYVGCQNDSGFRKTLVFKRDWNSQDYLVISFPHNEDLPNQGSVMLVTYKLSDLGYYIGLSMTGTDPGAYE